MNSPDAIALHLRRLEESLLHVDVRSSPGQLATLLDPEFIEIGSSGDVYTRAEIIEGLAAEPPAERRLLDFRARMLSPTIALVRYIALKKDSAGGPPTSSLRSSTWMLQPGGVARPGVWRMVFHQGTPARAALD